MSIIQFDPNRGLFFTVQVDEKNPRGQLIQFHAKRDIENNLIWPDEHIDKVLQHIQGLSEEKKHPLAQLIFDKIQVYNKEHNNKYQKVEEAMHGILQTGNSAEDLLKQIANQEKQNPNIVPALHRWLSGIENEQQRIFVLQRILECPSPYRILVIGMDPNDVEGWVGYLKDPQPEFPQAFQVAARLLKAGRGYDNRLILQCIIGKARVEQKDLIGRAIQEQVPHESLPVFLTLLQGVPREHRGAAQHSAREMARQMPLSTKSREEVQRIGEILDEIAGFMEQRQEAREFYLNEQNRVALTVVFCVYFTEEQIITPANKKPLYELMLKNMETYFRHVRDRDQLRGEMCNVLAASEVDFKKECLQHRPNFYPPMQHLINLMEPLLIPVEAFMQQGKALVELLDKWERFERVCLHGKTDPELVQQINQIRNARNPLKSRLIGLSGLGEE